MISFYIIPLLLWQNQKNNIYSFSCLFLYFEIWTLKQCPLSAIIATLCEIVATNTQSQTAYFKYKLKPGGKWERIASLLFHLFMKIMGPLCQGGNNLCHDIMEITLSNTYLWLLLQVSLSTLTQCLCQMRLNVRMIMFSLDEISSSSRLTGATNIVVILRDL